MSGWGTTSTRDPNGRARALVKAEIPIAPQNYCNDRLGRLGARLTKDEMCVRTERGRDTCDGDSGGEYQCCCGFQWSGLFQAVWVRFEVENDELGQCVILSSSISSPFN